MPPLSWKFCGPHAEGTLVLSFSQVMWSKCLDVVIHLVSLMVPIFCWELKFGEPARLWGQESRTSTFPVYETLSSYNATVVTYLHRAWRISTVFKSVLSLGKNGEELILSKFERKGFSTWKWKSLLSERNGVIMHSKPLAKFHRIRNPPGNSIFVWVSTFEMKSKSVIWIFQVWKLLEGKIGLCRCR